MTEIENDQETGTIEISPIISRKKKKNKNKNIRTPVSYQNYPGQLINDVCGQAIQQQRDPTLRKQTMLTFIPPAKQPRLSYKPRMLTRDRTGIKTSPKENSLFNGRKRKTQYLK